MSKASLAAPYLVAAALLAPEAGAQADLLAPYNVETTVEIRLLKAGKPLTGALVVSCADRWTRDTAKCVHPVSAVTDADGHASLVLVTGVGPASRGPGPSGLAWDPHMSFWFQVLAGSDSREYDWIMMGYGHPGRWPLACDVDSPPQWPRERFRLPSLRCDIGSPVAPR